MGAGQTHENNGPSHLLFFDQREEQIEISTTFHIAKNCAYGVITLPPWVFGLDPLDDFRR